MSEIESGFKWWMRYVIVPIIGGGGIIAIIVTVIDKRTPATIPTNPVSTIPQSPGARTLPKDNELKQEENSLWVDDYPREGMTGNIVVEKNKQIHICFRFKKIGRGFEIVQRNKGVEHSWGVSDSLDSNGLGIMIFNSNIAEESSLWSRVVNV